MNRILLMATVAFLALVGGAFPAHAEQNRAKALSINDMNNMLMDLRMAREDMKRSRTMYPLEMFDYQRMDKDMSVIISQLETYLFPRVKINQDAIHITLNGRYFKEAVENDNIITPLPEKQQQHMMSIKDLPNLPSVTEKLTPQDMSYLNSITKKNTVTVIRERKVVHDQPIIEKQITKEIVKVPAKPSIKAPISPEGVVYDWERYYNAKDLHDMMGLYSPDFKGATSQFDKRRKDFVREFTAYRDAKIRVYNIASTKAKDGGWEVDFDAQTSGNKWVEYTHGHFVLNPGLKIIDEKWTPSVPVNKDSGPQGS